MVSWLLSLLCALSVGATVLYDRNLAYRSPYADHPQLSIDTKSLQSRHLQEFQRRQTTENHFDDSHYPTFYGSHLTVCRALGDPFDTSVLIWTRAFPLGTGPDQSVPVCVEYSMFSSPSTKGPPIKTDQGFTSWDVDFTVKFEVAGLKPDTQYFYVFADCTNPSTISPVGRTRTLPSPNTPAEKVNGGKALTLAVFSCSQYQTGWFNAYGVAAHNTSADIFVHLGDYIYESLGDGASIGRAVLGRELATIHDYRQRYAQYRTDPPPTGCSPKLSLDHCLVADNTWKAGSTDSNDTTVGCAFSISGACFTDRKFAAVRAYHEWLPIRQVETTDLLRIWRNFQIGKLLDLTMLDTRQYDRDITDVTYNHVVAALATQKDRSLMGAAQEKCSFSLLYPLIPLTVAVGFADTLVESQNRGAIWRIVGQQIVFTEITLNGAFRSSDLSSTRCILTCYYFSRPGDDWDGYRANRQRLLEHLYTHKISNTILLSGDSHANWVSEALSGKGAIAVEFAGTAVTSPSPFGVGITPAQVNPLSALLLSQNTDMQWSEGSFRGFFTLTIDAKKVNATYYAMSDISTSNLNGFASATFLVNVNENRLARPVGGGAVAAGVLKAT
ncbi:PhoD-like phosphatase-domain-containing protein [Mycena amicta]|nr:PhoD-like phosphatase-domain-containing protein [Mycena amicta]